MTYPKLANKYGYSKMLAPMEQIMLTTKAPQKVRGLRTLWSLLLFSCSLYRLVVALTPVKTVDDDGDVLPISSSAVSVSLRMVRKVTGGCWLVLLTGCYLLSVSWRGGA